MNSISLMVPGSVHERSNGTSGRHTLTDHRRDTSMYGTTASSSCNRTIALFQEIGLLGWSSLPGLAELTSCCVRKNINWGLFLGKAIFHFGYNIFRETPRHKKKHVSAPSKGNHEC